MTIEQRKEAINLLHNTYGPPVRHYWLEDDKITTSGIPRPGGCLQNEHISDEDVLIILQKRADMLSEQIRQLSQFFKEL